MNLNDFWIFSRSGRDFSGAVSTPSGAKRLVWVLITGGFLSEIERCKTDMSVYTVYYRQTGLSHVKMNFMGESKNI